MIRTLRELTGLNAKNKRVRIPVGSAIEVVRDVEGEPPVVRWRGRDVLVPRAKLDEVRRGRG